MAQLTDPFVSLNWGWNDGESGWGSGMNENLIIYAFFHTKRIDGVLATGSLLPVSPTEGQAFFVNSDRNVYIRANNTWYNTAPPVGMTFVLKTDESVVKFNGTTLVADTKTIAEVTGLQSALDAKIPLTQKGAINGVAPLGADGKVPLANLPAGESYLGTWNAATNTPTITSGVGTTGEYYKVSNGGSTTIDGVSTWGIGDEIKFNGTVWQRIPNTAAVSSVNGQTGPVVLTNTDVGAAATSHTHSNATTSASGFFSNTDKTKLDGVAVGATANSSDATLLNRANHTGTQASSTISDLTETVQDIVGTMFVAGTNTTVTYNDGANTIAINASGSGGSSTFTGLSDVPDSYIGQGNKVVRVNSGETAVEFVSVGTAAFSNAGDFAAVSHVHDATAISTGTLADARLPSTQTGKIFSSTVNLQSNLNFTGTTSRVTADFSNTTHGTRLIFQTSSANSSSGVGVMANGTGAGGYYNTYSGSDANNASLGQFFTTVAETSISTTKTGTGVATPLNLKTDGVTRVSISPTGDVTLPSTTSIGNVSSTEISYLDGVTSAIQTQLNNKQPLATVLTNTTAAFTTALETKLNGIAAGAEVNVNADWNAVSGDAQILNKPTTVSGFGITNAVTLDTAQNVTGAKSFAANLLVGTTVDEGYKLDVNGYTRIKEKLNLTAADAAIDFIGGNNGLDNIGIYFRPFQSDRTNPAQASITALDNNYSASILFKTKNVGAVGNALVERMRLSTSGNLLVGTATDSGYKLDVNGTARVSGVLTADGSGLNSLNASNISSGTLADARLPTTLTGKTFTSKVLARFDAGATPTYSTGQLELSNNGSGNPVTLGFHREGLTAVALVHSAPGTLRLDSTTYGSVTSSEFQAGKLVSYGIVQGTEIHGSGANLTALNASNITTGTVAVARLPSASTSAQGIVQLSTSLASTSTTTAPTSSALADVYDYASDTNSIATDANNTAISAYSLAQTSVQKATPSQTFQSLGTVSGSVTVNGANGTHVLATVNGNTTWTFPTPSSVEALAITLELTNGGAYTMTWPAGTRWAGGVAPTLTASGTDILVFTKAGTNNWRGYLSSKDNK